MKLLIFALGLALAFLALFDQAGAATVSPGVSLTAEFTAKEPFDGYLIQVLFGGFTDDFPTAGEELRVRLFDSSNSLVATTGVLDVGWLSYLDAWDVRSVSGLTSAFSVVVDSFVGSFEVHAVNFYPWLVSQNYWDFDNLQIVQEELQVSQVPLPATFPLLLAASAIFVWAGCRRRRVRYCRKLNFAN